MIGTSLGHYRITAKLGAGGMGEVYIATDTKLKREVAIKVLPASLANDPERLARFQREAQVLAALNHPNIAQIYGLEQNALIMELIHGETIKGPLDPGTVANYAIQIAGALEVAHEKGIVHRDLKPANIMITPAGVIKVLDFGLAKVAEPAPAADGATLTMHPTEAGVIMGTAAYMSPEQAAGKPIDKRSDIWSYGVVLHELITGKKLFDGESFSHTLADVLRAPIDLSKLPNNTLKKIINRCLDRNPKTRLQDIAEARIALANPEPETATQKPTKWIIATAVTALIALSTLYLRPSPQPQQIWRFQIQPPEKTTVQNFALSPDSRRLVISGLTAGNRRLWLRDMDGLAFQPIPGTEDGSWPFWSPDSRNIGFFANGKLKKIQAAGGPPIVLADALDGRGGAWNQHGQIVFAPSQQDTLYVIPAAGGTPVPVLSAKGVHNHRFPVFLPDGKRILSHFGFHATEKSGVYVNSLDGAPPRLILADNSSALWQSIPGDTRTGLILFRRDESYMAQRVTTAGLELEGEAFPIAAEPMASASLIRILASVSPQGTLIMQKGNSGRSGSLAWYGRDGARLSTVGPPSERNGFSLSPDEKTLAASGLRDRRNGIWLADAGRGAETLLTNDGFHPLWTPSGAEIVYSNSRRSPTRPTGTGLFLLNRSGAGTPKLLLEADSDLTACDWVPGTKALLYSERGRNSGLDLWVLPETGKPQPFLKTPFNEHQARISPDGRWVAYTSNESGHDEIYVRSYPGGQEVRRVSLNGGWRPLWTGDGKEIFYLTPASEVMAVTVKLIAKTVELDAPEKLFSFTPPAEISTGLRTIDAYNYAVTRDGKRFVVIESASDTANTPLTVITNWLPGAR